MSILNIPLDGNITNYSETISLDSKIYRLDIKYQSRMDRWIMDILDNEARVLLAGITMLIGVDFLSTHRDRVPALPPGQFIVYNSTDKNIEPDRNNINDTLFLAYIDLN